MVCSQRRLPDDVDTGPHRPHRRGLVLSLLTRWHQVSDRLEGRHVNHLGHRQSELTFVGLRDGSAGYVMRLSVMMSLCILDIVLY